MKRIISLLLTALMAFSVLTVGAASVSAAEGDIPAGTVIYFDNTNTKWDNVYFYAWKFGFFGDTYELSPISEDSNLYSMVLPQDVTPGEAFFLFKSAEDWNGKQTTDQAAYADLNTYTPLVDAQGNVLTTNVTYTDIKAGPQILATPSSREFTDPLTVTVYEFNATNATYTVNNGEPVTFTDTATINVTTDTTIVVDADGVKPQTYKYTKVNNATVNVAVLGGYTGDIYMYTFGGDRIGSEFVLMDKNADGTYTATINGSAQVIFTTGNDWDSKETQKFIILNEDGDPATDQEPLVSAGTTVTFRLQAPEVTPTTPTSPVVES